MSEAPSGDATRDADVIEAAAMHDMWVAAEEPLRSDASLIAARFGDCMVMGSAALASLPLLNRVMGATAASIADGTLEQAIGVLADRGCACQIGVYENTPDGDALTAWLTERGFSWGYSWMRFIHPGTAAEPEQTPDGVTVRHCEPADAEVFGTTFAAAFGLPAFLGSVAQGAVGRTGWHCFLAETEGGEPVGTGALFVDGASGWLGFGGTLPQARGRGAQGALLRERVAHAMRLDCSLIVTETGERVDDRPAASYRNILRAGFREHALRRHLVRMPDSSE